ncbi:MAG: PQQ-dependent sugar dehydrogenase, partial [Anaerolineales bacterium]|nr:PQQ-dependent sugar dehydrogenase [Anaerolineales bacterium]
ALAWLAAGAAPAAAVSAPAGWQPAAPWATALAQATITPIATGLGTPTGITHAGDGSGRIFIVEQPGRIRIYDGTQLLPTPFLDVSGLVTSGGERGLLGLAFHPNYAANGYFFVNYTDSAGDTVVARYTVSANPNVADAGSAVIALRVDQPFANHNGGQLQFGPDGYLYVGLGDGGSAGDPGNRAQNLGLLLGKILRLDVDGGGLPPDCDAGGQYTIPADNPFVATAGACGEIWAYGLRNPWRFSFDRASGDLYIADVGQSAWEEIDFQPASSAGGENYGWRLMEGFSCYNPSTNCNDGSLTLPVVVYPHTAGLCSITGGYVYRGSAAPGAAGAYIFGDYCTGQIAATRQDGAGSWQTSIIRDTNLGISSFGETESGELCVGDGFGGAVYCLFP